MKMPKTFSKKRSKDKNIEKIRMLKVKKSKDENVEDENVEK